MSSHFSRGVAAITLILPTLLAGEAFGQAASAPAVAVAPTPSVTFEQDKATGIFPGYIDGAVKPGADFYRYANGKWLDSATIPADRSSWGAAEILQERVRIELRDLIVGLSSASSAVDPGVRQRVADLYASYLDEGHIETLGASPIDGEIAKINAMSSTADVWATAGRLSAIGVDSPLVPSVEQDSRDATKYVVGLDQDGLGLPDRDYYLDMKDARFANVREKYVSYIEHMFTLAHYPEPKASAQQVFELETELAKISWDVVDLRDAIKTYNKIYIRDLAKRSPGFDSRVYLTAAGVTGKADYIIVGEPSYLNSLAKLVLKTPVSTWQAYFRWQVLSAYAPYLSSAFVNERFAFVGTVLSGTPENAARWKRGLTLVDSLLGEDLGQLYVAKYFPPESKARAEKLVANFLLAYKESIKHLDWMTPATRAAAEKKLAKITPKIGYPSKWMDYSSVVIKKDDLVGNRMRAAAFLYQYQLNKLGHPVDRLEWDMTPPTINAYYNANLNEIVFPAGMLQPPYFMADSDDAANYGAIGQTIGHEISHGFDDQGSLYDGEGNLHKWWTAADRAKFTAKTKALVAQYSKFEPVPGYHVNGELTLGENIADNAGLQIAYRAYHLSLGGEPAPVIDGLTGDQRFYLGFAQSYLGKVRDDQLVIYLKSDPHSPDPVRVLATTANQDSFYEAFHIQPGDPMYIAPEKRVHLW